MHVVDQGLKIVTLLLFHHDCLVTPAKEVPPELVFDIEASGVCVLKPLHPSYQICLRRLQHQVVMLAHQGMHPDFAPAAHFAQSAQKHPAVVIVHNDIRSPITAR